MDNTTLVDQHRRYTMFDVVTAVCIMIDRSQKLVEWDFSFPMTGFYGFDKGVNDDE